MVATSRLSQMRQSSSHMCCQSQYVFVTRTVSLYPTVNPNIELTFSHNCPDGQTTERLIPQDARGNLVAHPVGLAACRFFACGYSLMTECLVQVIGEADFQFVQDVMTRSGV